MATAYERSMEQGREYMAQGRYDLASGAFFGASKQNKTSAEALYYLALAQKEDMPSRFARELTEHELSPSRIGISWVEALGATSDEEQVKRVVILHDRWAASKYRLAVTTTRCHLVVACIEPLQKALKLKPGLPEAQRLLDELLPFGKSPHKGGCYIATACYGSYDHPDVRVLRRFRDERLMPHSVGRHLVALYYALSPRLARWIGANRCLSGLIRRRMLQPLVRRLNGDR